MDMVRYLAELYHVARMGGHLCYSLHMNKECEDR